MQHKGTVTIETPRLVLRRFSIDDLSETFDRCWSDYEVWKWTRYARMDSLDDVTEKADMFTEKWLGAYARANRYSWAITEKATGAVIGRVFGMNTDDIAQQIEITYELGRKWWNQGLMTEAVTAVIDFFFNDVGLNRVYAYHASGNPASGRVMQKCGMRYEGTMRQACGCNAGVFDKVNYGLLRADCR